MNALISVAPRVSRLIPLLGSDHDGEALGAARAITRTLRSRGLTLHDLAEALSGSIRAVQVAPPCWAAMSRPQQLDALECLLANGRLTDWERSFCADIRSDLYARSEQSPKQRAVLDRIIGEKLP
jgi:hypothetical protein